ncbi:MAG: GNAT family N-acetyltransferase [Pseudomonadota bacterium]
MTGIVVLNAADAQRMAHLHAAAFPSDEAWTAESFEELFALSSTLALGIEGDLSLSSLVVFQKMAPQAEILTFATAPTSQRKGYATTLLSGSLKILNQHGVYEILLDVAEDNQPAMTFYKQNGFRENGRRKGYYRRSARPHVDAILMSLTSTGHTTPKRA